MVEKGSEYALSATTSDRGWVFCPEYIGASPLEISVPSAETRMFLFGSGFLPDSGVYPGEATALTDLSQSAGGSVASSNFAQPDDQSTEGTVPVPEARVENLPGPASTEDWNPPSVRLGTDVLTGGEVRWPVTLKGNPHLLVAGLPGMGKTTCLLNLCRQMLECGIHPIVFSYHQDIDERLTELVSQVRFIDFHGLGFNPLQIMDRETRMAHLDVAGAMRDIFAAIFPEIGDIQGERIRKAVKDSFTELGWDKADVPAGDLSEPPFRRFLDILRSETKPDRGLRTLLARLEELDDYGLFDVGDVAESLWDSPVPTIIRIHATRNDNLQRAFSSLIFYGLYKDMFRRGVQDRITHAVVFDEAHRASRLTLIPTMAKECRKYGISLVLASQEARDFNISLFSAIANYLVLRLNETDAKALARNVASSDQERALVDKIKQLDRFKALYFSEGKNRPSYLLLSP
jgi:DNA phosphorothioation-dependent restriction protein DptH